MPRPVAAPSGCSMIYAKLSGSKGFARSLPDGDLQANVSADYTQTMTEFGGAYEIWSGRNPGFPSHHERR